MSERRITGRRLGRTNKFRTHQVVYYDHRDYRRYGIIADHKRMGNNYYYHIIECDEFGRKRGFGRWVETSRLTAVVNQHGYPRMARRWEKPYRQNLRMANRGCECHCCHHVNINREVNWWDSST